jgi:hypothetical protein
MKMENQKLVPAVSLAEYISVLECEVNTLLTDYYKGDKGIGATGHFNTAATVLKERIQELKNKGC